MGSGKSRLITDLASEYACHNKVLIVAPYRDNRDAYTKACSYIRHAPDFESEQAVELRLEKAEKGEGYKSPVYVWINYVSRYDEPR